MKQWIVAVIAVLAMSGSVDAVEYTWTGAGGDGHWGTKANWKPASGVPGAGDDVIFPETEKPVEITLEADHAARSITFNPGNPVAYTINGCSITLDDDGVISYLKLVKDPGLKRNAKQTINSDLKLAGRATIRNENRWFVGNELLDICGRVSGTQSLTINGGSVGCVGLSKADNTNFSGRVFVESGILVVRSTRGLGLGKQPIVMNSGSLWCGGLSLTQDFLITGSAGWSALVPAGPHTGTITVQKGGCWTYGSGGNNSTMQGVIAGQGDVVVDSGHGTMLGGTAPNTLSGTYTVQKGLTVLAKPAGVDAISGPLVLARNARLRWDADDQIADRLSVTLREGRVVLDLNGHREQVGTLALQGSCFIDCGDGSDLLQVADSHKVVWDYKNELVVRKWGGRKMGGGSDRIIFGNSAESLTSEQLACLGFRDPAGFPGGLYNAAILQTGEIVPSKPVRPVNPPYDLSDKARSERQKLYEVPGLADLSGKDTPLKKGMKISFYGDSITWNRSYIGRIETALKNGEGSKDLGVQLINHGVNGGGVLTLRDGDEGKAHFGNTQPRPFAETLGEDKPDVVVVYIGINDIWWRNTSPETFEKALTDLADSAKANKVPVVLTTLGVWGDNPSTEEKKNLKCDEYSDIVRKVALANNVTLADLRKACVAYLMNHNGELQLNGRLRFAPTGIISSDGVHLGGNVPADVIAKGIYDALKQ